ncbi:hypothetical protein KFK09_004621 [Dendrobium nobile]|uniref:Uncharacterized protein n=1 Tax=Dendrobium nobile TaxID=94219 RepID=A0A8T3C6R5_DENNO|nr:hypothetical protein KFK09_004621 [Dendrobium nobile]
MEAGDLCSIVYRCLIVCHPGLCHAGCARMAGQQSLIKLIFLWEWEIVRGDSAPWVLPCASSLGCTVLSASHVPTPFSII